MPESSKLDALVDRIYQEGVDKSNKEASDIIEKARAEAEHITRSAKENAQSIIKQAEDKAATIKRNVISDVELAGGQSISAIKQNIKELITDNILSDNLGSLFVDVNFLKELILEMSKKWDDKEGFTEKIDFYFPESLKSKIDDSFANSIKTVSKDVSINFDSKLKNGFKLEPSGATYRISFTDEDFVAFFKPFVKEQTEKILFSK